MIETDIQYYKDDMQSRGWELMPFPERHKVPSYHLNAGTWSAVDVRQIHLHRAVAFKKSENGSTRTAVFDFTAGRGVVYMCSGTLNFADNNETTNGNFYYPLANRRVLSEIIVTPEGGGNSVYDTMMGGSSGNCVASKKHDYSKAFEGRDLLTGNPKKLLALTFS